MDMPKEFDAMVVGGFVKGWNSYYDKETKTRHYYSEWIATQSVLKVRRDDCFVYAEFGSAPEDIYTVASLSTEDSAKAELINLIGRLSKIGLPDNLKTQLVAMEQ